MTKKVLLAVGDQNLSAILRKHFMNDEYFSLTSQEVFHISYLEEIVESHLPDLVILHETYLESSFTELDERENEWINLIKKIRFTYEDQIRIVFLCERPKGDPFLSKLVSVNVLDIFNSRYIDSSEMMAQLKEKPLFYRVAKLLGDDVAFTLNQHEESDIPDEPKDEEKLKKEKVVVQKVVEKKVINKQVIKKQYQLNVKSQVEKIVGVNIERRLILVGSPFDRVGSTFFSHHLAKQLSNKGIGVSYIENPYKNSYTYDRFDGDRNASPDYRSIFYAYTHNEKDFPQHDHLITYFDYETSKEPIYQWEHEGVKMLATHPDKETVYDETDIGLMKFTKILLSLQKTPYVIVDVGNDWDKDIFKELMQLSDYVFTVLNPDIPNLESYNSPKHDMHLMKRINPGSAEHFIVGNQFTPTIAKDVLGEGYFTIPQFPSEAIYQAQYKGSFLFQNRELNNLLSKAFTPILDELLPVEFVKKKQQENRWFSKLFNKKIEITEV